MRFATLSYGRTDYLDMFRINQFVKKVDAAFPPHVRCLSEYGSERQETRSVTGLLRPLAVARMCLNAAYHCTPTRQPAIQSTLKLWI